MAYVFPKCCGRQGLRELKDGKATYFLSSTGVQMKILTKKFTSYALASVLLLSSAAYAAAAPSGELTVAVGATAPQLNPMKTVLPPNISVGVMVHENLFRMDEHNNVVPDLATKWSYSEDGLTFKVTIKTNHVFSNGDPLDSAAVASSLNRLKDPKSGSINTELYSALGQITTPAPDTLEFHLKSKNGHLLILLANPAAGIIDTKAEDAMGPGEFARHPIGSGPYVVEDFKPNEKMSVVPNPKYVGDLPATLQRVTFLTVPEDASRMALLETGEADIVAQVPAESLKDLEALKSVKVEMPDDMFSISMEILMRGPFADKRVREALNISIDRKGMIEGILGGLAVPETTQVGPGTQNGMRKEFAPIPYDPARAKQLLADAGYKPGSIKLILHCPNGRYIKDAQVCQALAAQWQAIGINAEARVYDLATWSAKNRLPFDKREDNMTMLGRATPGIDYTLYRLFYTGVGSNTTGFSDPRVDKLLDEGRSTLDVEQQKKIYGEVQQIVWDEMPFVFLWYPKQVVAFKKDVEGVVFKPEEVMLFDHAKIAH